MFYLFDTIFSLFVSLWIMIPFSPGSWIIFVVVSIFCSFSIIISQGPAIVLNSFNPPLLWSFNLWLWYVPIKSCPCLIQIKLLNPKEDYREIERSVSTDNKLLQKVQKRDLQCKRWLFRLLEGCRGLQRWMKHCMMQVGLQSRLQRVCRVLSADTNASLNFWTHVPAMCFGIVGTRAAQFWIN